MPHVFYLLAWVLCPWAGCGFRAEGIDFRLEVGDDKPLYRRAMLAWGQQPGYGLVGRCPHCRQYVWFDPTEKRAIAELPDSGYDLLPDAWHSRADIMDKL